jgi:hypothetical protein
MSTQLFELEWLGGSAERYFRRQRPGIDALPWGSLEPKRYPPALVDAARASWTEGAYSEYRTAAAFGQLLTALLVAGAPVDLVGMAGGFIADEMVHTELNSRMAMQLGGGAPYLVEADALLLRTPRHASPLLCAVELAVRLCCVAEAFSVPLLAGSMRAAAHPLSRAVLERIVVDEAPHALLGWLVLDWAHDRLDAADRAQLASAAVDTLRACVPGPGELVSELSDGCTSEGYCLQDVHALGWMESSDYRACARAAVWRDIVTPLSRYEIVLDHDEVTALLC